MMLQRAESPEFIPEEPKGGRRRRYNGHIVVVRPSTSTWTLAMKRL